MSYPNPPSLLLFLGAAFLVVSTRISPPSSAVARVSIDTSFLQTLSRMPVDRSLTEDEVSIFGTLTWENSKELRYLALKGDPAAVHCVVRILASGGTPGSCSCCDDEFNTCVFEGGAEPAFWSALEALPTQQQLRVLFVGDSVGYSEVDALTTWEDDRDHYLAAHPETQAAYAGVQSELREDSDPQNETAP